MINRSVVISQREAFLTERALVVSVIANHPGELADSIVPAIAQRFEIEDALLTLQHLGTASFLLISPDEATAAIIFNGGRTFTLPGGRLHFLR